MPPTSATTPTNAVILEKIENQRCDLAEIKDILKAHDAREQTFEKEYYIQHQVVLADINAIKEKVSIQERRLAALEALVIELAQSNKIAKWLMGVVTAVVVSLLIAWATGKLQVVFP